MTQFRTEQIRENILSPQMGGDIRQTEKTRSCAVSGHITPSFEDSVSSLLIFTLSFPHSHLILLPPLSSSSR